MSYSEKWQLVCDEMEKSYAVLAQIFKLAPSRFGGDWAQQSVRNIETMYGPIERPISEKLVAALDGYAEFSNDSMRNQVFFERHGHYKASKYSEVVTECYHNEEHMTRRYLPGMYLSHYIWPQHYHMLQGFIHGLLPRIPECKLFFEVGVGCGMYSKATLEALPKARGIGFDISQYALDFTYDVVKAFGMGDRYKIVNQDVRHGYPELCDFMICQEVLEHLENPAEFCTWLYAMVKPGGHAYITAALNAAHSDHIFLFHDPMQLETMLRDAGFQPLHCQEESAPGFKPRSITPSLCGFFCEKPGK